MHFSLKFWVLSDIKSPIENCISLSFLSQPLLCIATPFSICTCAWRQTSCVLSRNFKRVSTLVDTSPFNNRTGSIGWYPYMRKNGLYSILLFGSEFATISTVGRNSRHLFRSETSLILQQSVCDIIAFILSSWPSLWGWYAVLYFSFVPSSDQISRRHLATNWAPWSIWMARGTPSSFTTCCQYNRAVAPTMVIFLQGIKCTILVAWSTTVIIESLVPPATVKSVTKSMLTSCHLTSGMVRDWRFPLHNV